MCGKQREATAPVQSLVKLQPWFLSLRWKTCLRQNCSLGFSACSEGPAIGQNTDEGDILILGPILKYKIEQMQVLLSYKMCSTSFVLIADIF